MVASSCSTNLSWSSSSLSCTQLVATVPVAADQHGDISSGGRDRKRKRPATTGSDAVVPLLAPAPKIPATTTTTSFRQQLHSGPDVSHPLMFLKLILSTSPEGKALLLNHTQSFSFHKPSQEEIDSYDMEVVTAVRSGSVEKLRGIMNQGRKTFNACNRFGESLIHMACRRGNVAVVRFLITEGGTRTDIRDDYGRTPAHDACWTAEANIDVMDELLQHIPIAMLLTEDVRGYTPFQYARKEHWPKWIEFLQDRRLILLKRLVVDLDEEKLTISG